jgi:hypothetical protein
VPEGVAWLRLHGEEALKPIPITEPPADRECGDCQACCEVLEIRPFSTDDGHEVVAADDAPVLAKRWERCQWQCDKGCTIYQHRPSPCAAYHCMWRLGWGDDDARPDRLGVLAEGAPNGWVFLVEVRKGGALEQRTLEYMQAMREHPTKPCTAIHVTPYGAEGYQQGFWLDSVPEDVEGQLAGVWEAIQQQRAQSAKP